MELNDFFTLVEIFKRLKNVLILQKRQFNIIDLQLFNSL